MLSLLGFLIMLGPLVIVHEFGHYIFARIFGVKAEIFSVGFGPKFWSKQLGETELRLCVVPLGGYVKLLGEDREAKLSPEEQKRSLHRQVPWKRFFIFFGGPFFNFLFAILVFMIILLIGEPQPASVIGRVVRGSAADQVGFQSGDKILAIDGKSVQRYEELLKAISENPGKTLKFQVQHPRSETPVMLQAVPQATTGFSEYGEVTRVGEIDGMFLFPRAAQVGVSNPQSLAAKAGLSTGDLIEAVNSTPVRTWEDIELFYDTAKPGTELKIKFMPKNKAELQEAVFKKIASGKTMGEEWGLFSSELFVEKVVPKSPAEAIGIRPGDRLVGIGKLDVPGFFALKDAVQKSGEEEGKVALRWEREGKFFSETVVPTATPVRDPLLKKTNQFTVGVVPMLTAVDAPTVIERVWNPFLLLYKGTERMVSFTWKNLVSIQKMITGDVSVATLGGPILIGKIAGESLSRGARAFLSMMAILSVGLGVLNLLPVPVLDGGHLMLLGIEIVRGKPLNLRTMEIIQLVGLSLILLLMLVVIRNDIARLSYF